MGATATDADFGREYYRKYYLDGRTSVTSRAEMNARARLIGAFVDHVGLPVRRILDAGCGLGLLRTPLRRALPRATYTGLETSRYLCDRFGWIHGELQHWRASRPYDLVICYDVVQYLDDRDATRALGNLATSCRGVLYFSALTLEDWQHNCDRSRTDGNAHLRPGEWYRDRLARRFQPIGAGFWVRRGAPVVIWELERPE